MQTLFTIIHILVSLFLIFIVLIQSSKGAEMGAVFGGSSQTLFGSRGAATFLGKITTGSAVIFMITSFLLAFLSVQSGSVVKTTLPLEQRQGIPAQQGPLQGAPQETLPQSAQPAPQPQK